MKDVVQHIGRLQVFRPGLFILVSLAALLRLAMSFHFPRAVKEDEPAYLLLGQNLWAGNGFTYTGLPELHFPPLHPLLIGLFSFITRDLEMASNLEHAVFGGLLLLPVFAIALRIYGVQTAWLAVILLALFPPLTVSVLYWGSMSESTFLFFLFSALALFLAGLDDERPWMVSGAGGVLGLAYLIRDEAIAFFGALTIFVVLWLWTHEKAQTFRMWRAVVLFVLSFVLVAAPYIWYLHVHTGKWMISGKLNVSWKAGAGYGDNGKSLDQLYNGLDSSGEEINSLSMERFREDLLGHVISHPSDILHRVVRHAGSLKEQFFTRSSFWWGLTPLVVLGLFNQPWDRRRLRYEAFLITIIVVLLIVFLPFGFLVRYFAPAYPVLLMWTAMGALGLGRWLQDTVMLAGQCDIQSGASLGHLGTACDCRADRLQQAPAASFIRRRAATGRRPKRPGALRHREGRARRAGPASNPRRIPGSAARAAALRQTTSCCKDPTGPTPLHASSHRHADHSCPLHA